MSIRTIVRILKLGAGTRKYKGGPRRTGTGRDGPCASPAGFGPTLSDPVRLNIDAAQTSTVPTRMPQAQSLAAADAALIAAWQGGDEQAAAELVRRHARALARFLAAAGAPEADLDDLVQETFIRAFRAVARFRGQCQFRTWLLTIGGNVLKDAARRFQQVRVVPL